ncbi:hypothetical protein [Sphingobacterium bovisgrunnientis]|uniref:hypothetical protein n=1 Tax=Sphingobacterium bovisgrunnientis TaxID=1874697 RepID=UPI001357E51C|nr:hypothetical protein [Sphingobacterium bovisgrunnientis]
MYKALVFIFCFIFNVALAQQAKWYLPWDNEVSKLTVDKVEGIPILLKGVNYRILKISGANSNKITFKCSSSKVKVSFNYLPSIKNYSKRTILDAILPLEMQELSQEMYFLVKFEGIRSGHENVTISISNTDIHLKKQVIVSNLIPSIEYDINVWSYFDYNSALVGKRKQVESMLQTYGFDNIVIPPFALPKISQGNLNFSKLESYLPLGSTKFKRYFVFLNLNKKGLKFDENFKISYKEWVYGLRKVFKSRSIPIENIYIYLIDEPDIEGVQFINKVISLDSSLALNSNFYSTFGSNTNQVYSIKNNKTFIAQVVAKKINLKPTFTNKSYNYWSYNVVSKSRNVKPIYFISQASEALNYNLQGIGVWNFCDINKAYNSQDLTKALNRGSWKMPPTSPIYDYSLIYFDKNNIYPSIRLVALASSRDDYIFLTQLKQVAGKRSIRDLGIDLYHNYGDWEKMKFNFLKSK